MPRVYTKNQKKRYQKKHRKRIAKRIGEPSKASYVNMWHLSKTLPERLRNRMKYSALISFNNVTGSYGEYVFRMNSLFDTDFTGAGQQPTGFDQFATFYNTYRVIESSCKIRYIPQAPAAGSDASTGALVLYPSDTSAGVTGYADALSIDRSKSTNYGFYAGSTGSSVLRTKMPIATIAGTKLSTIENEDNFASAVTTSPVNTYYWIVGNYNSSTATADIEVQVELEFWVEWTQRLMLNQS